MRKPFMVEFTGTPEAGITTTIKNVSNKLKDQGYSVAVLHESAESLPDEIPKGTWDANLWMHYQTLSGIVRARYFQTDIVLIDRGLVDSSFYGKKFLWKGECSEEQYKKFREQFIDDLFPNFLIALTVSPRVAIRRRGGEGHLVTKDYIRDYNHLFMTYYSELDCKKVLINTGELNVYQMNKMIYEIILENLP